MMIINQHKLQGFLTHLIKYITFKTDLLNLVEKFRHTTVLPKAKSHDSILFFLERCIFQASKNNAAKINNQKIHFIENT
jgi:hypothetical protein